MAAGTSICVTGSKGFIGKNLCQVLSSISQLCVCPLDHDSSSEVIAEALSGARVIIHLAGINRPTDPKGFQANAELMRTICAVLQEARAKPLVVFASSTQAALDNPYGDSKRAAEELLKEWVDQSGGSAVVLRLPNVFGKWARPEYNSAVATFCYNIARGLPIRIDDPSRSLDLLYIDDLVQRLTEICLKPDIIRGFSFQEAAPSYNTTVGFLAETIRAFPDLRSTLTLPDFGDPLVKALYSTYLSYLPTDRFAYQLVRREDPRGALAEFLRTKEAGQIFVSRTRPGITRGNHFHHSKVEKFLVLEGTALIRFRHVATSETASYTVDGKDFKVVDIPPGYTHSIENQGKSDLVTLFWANEPFDPARPDTIPCEVINDEA
ncbi:MAG: NAD-dependent epimerase/dehydratase family protein [Oligoflexia bacterium]|nr:NAD-dependent epimerase/dehydratase family protein [Oligoflexia bacterium]